MLSILIPTAGRGKVLPVVLNSLFNECRTIDYPTELNVIDNNADEDLIQCVRQQCKFVEGAVRYIHETSPSLSAVCHRGADEAEGELLVFLDDDVELGNGWLAGMLNGFSNTSLGLVGGPSIPRFGGSVPAWFWDSVTPTRYGGWDCTWGSLLDIGRPVVDVDPNFIWDLNFGIRRSVLRELGGFHSDLVPSHLQRWQGDGEAGLTLRARVAGVKACYVSEALLYHDVGPQRLTTEYFERRAYYQGVCDSFTQIRSDGSLAFNTKTPSSNKYTVPQYQDSKHRSTTATLEIRRLTAQAIKKGMNSIRVRPQTIYNSLNGLRGILSGMLILEPKLALMIQ